MTTLTSKALSILSILTLVLCSCKENSPSVHFLKQAQEQAEENPEKALVFLDSIHEPQRMGEDYYMQYIVTLTQAKCKTEQDLPGDTLIYKAQRYFNKKSDTKQKILTNFYAGIVNYDSKAYDRALGDFRLAHLFACQSNDTIFAAKSLFNTGYLYYQQEVLDSALVYYKQALDVYDNVKNTDVTKLKISTIRTVGLSYYAMDSIAEAYHFFKQGYELAKQNDDLYYQREFIRDLGLIYREQGNYTLASAYLHTALAQSQTFADSLMTDHNLALLYNNMNRPDSAQYYRNRLKKRLPEITNLYTLSNVYNILSNFARILDGNYEESLRYADLEKATDQKIFENNKARELLEADAKFQLAQKDRQLRKEKREANLYLFGGIVFLILFLIVMIYLRKSFRKETNSIQAEIDRVNSLRNGIPLNPQLLAWSKEFLNDDPLGKQIIDLLSDKEAVIMALIIEGYSKELISATLDMSVQGINIYKTNIYQALKEVGYSTEEAKLILCVDNHKL